MTQLRFVRGMLYKYNQNPGGIGEFMKLLYEFWGYCVNGTSALQVPGGFATSMTSSYSISAATNVTPIVITTTSTNALASNQQVSITGVTGNLAANGTWAITVVNSTQFSLNNSTGNGGYTGGGTVNTTAFGVPVNFTEGANVLAVGSDGYTANQVSTTLSGDAFFTATTNNPFTSTNTSLNVNGATNYQTTIAAGSNTQSLPQSIINIVSTTPASTTIAVGSNNVSLPTGTINVVSTTGFPSAGFIFVQTTTGIQQVNYTSTTATTFAGCTGGIGPMQTGGSVKFTFAPSGTINVTTSNGPQVVTYAGITATTLTGCSGGTGTMSTGGAVVAPIMVSTTVANTYPNLGSSVVAGVTGNTTANGTWIVITPTYGVSNINTIGATIGFSSNGASLPQATINSSTAAPFTTTTSVVTLPQASIPITATAIASTIITATSNGALLPQGTINVTSTTGFPTSGTLNVFSLAEAATTFLSDGQTLPQSIINVSTTAGFPISGTISIAVNTATTATGIQALPAGTINVVSTTGFPASGTLIITSSLGFQLITYTGGGGGGTTFTGCTGGAGNTSNGGAVNLAQTVVYTGTTGISFTGCTGGTGALFVGGPIMGGPFAQTVTYTGVAATTFTGCSGGVGEMITGNTVNNTGFFTNFPTAGSLYINTANGAQLVTYTSVDATHLLGASGGTGATSVGGSVFTAFSPAANYTSIAAGSNGASLPQGTINVASTTGFPSVGYIYVTTTNGFQVVNYTGTSGGNQFTGCTGGTGTMSTGNAIFTAYTPTGTLNITTSNGPQVVTYTGTTATTFTGGTGGLGTISTGGAIVSPILVTTSVPTPLATLQTVALSGVTGTTNANSSFTVTIVNNSNFALNGSLSNATYTGGGTVTDHSNFVLNGSAPNGTFAGSGTSVTSNMVNKLLTIWQPSSGTTEDSVYIITAVISPNTVKVNLNTGGTPDATTLHPSFNTRSGINYRVVDGGAAGVATGMTNAPYYIMQFSPSAVGINPGQANSQLVLSATNGVSSTSNLNGQLAPGGNWSGTGFPTTGNPNIDVGAAFGSFSGGVWSGSPANTLAITMAADPAFFWMHYLDLSTISSGSDGSSYIHVEIPIRLYPSSADTNPMVVLNRGGIRNGSVFNITGSVGGDFGTGFAMKGTDGVMRNFHSLAKSLQGDGTPTFGANLTDVRLSFNTTRGTVLASDIVLSLPGVAGQFALGRVKLRTMKFTNTPLPSYHRFGTAGGAQYLNIANGCAIIWDNTILPSTLFYLL